jgi:hypothetical protein
VLDDGILSKHHEAVDAPRTQASARLPAAAREGLGEGELEATGVFSRQGDVLEGEAGGFVAREFKRVLFGGWIVKPHVNSGLPLPLMVLLALLLTQQLFLLPTVRFFSARRNLTHGNGRRT